jgi:flagellar biosynthesis protein FlhG
MSKTGIFVTTPEPTSIENTYRLIRSLCTRKIKQILKNNKLEPWAIEALDRKRRSFGASPTELVAMINQNDPETGEFLEKRLQALQFKLVVNKLRKYDNLNLGYQMCRVCEKHLGLRMQFIGNIGFDNLVHDAVCEKVSFLDKYKYTQTAMDLQAACRDIIAMEERHLQDRPKEASPSSHLRLAHSQREHP